MRDYDLSDAEKDVLLCLSEKGDNIPANIADETGLHSKSVSRILSGSEGLESKGLIENKGRGVWTLTEEGAEVVGGLA
jgi:DNA-binding MarR family transcriptional regulator